MITIHECDTAQLAKFPTRDTNRTAHVLHYVVSGRRLTVTQYVADVDEKTDDKDRVVSRAVTLHKLTKRFTAEAAERSCEELDAWGLGRHLYQIRDVLKTGPARIHVGDGRIWIDCPYDARFERVTHYSLPTVPVPENFGEFGERTDAAGHELFRIDVLTLKRFVRELDACYARASMSGPVILGNVRIHSVAGGVEFVMTDRYRLAVLRYATDTPAKFDKTVDFETLKNGVAGLTQVVAFSERGADGVRLHDSDGHELLIDGTDGMYPSLRRVLSLVDKYPASHVVSLDVGKVANALKMFDKSAAAVHMRFGDDGLRFERVDESGRTVGLSEVLSAETGLCEFTIDVDPKYFRAVFRALKTGVKTIRVRYGDRLSALELTPIRDGVADMSHRLFVVPLPGGQSTCEHSMAVRKARQSPDGSDTVPAVKNDVQAHVAAKPTTPPAAKSPEPVAAPVTPGEVPSRSAFSWQTEPKADTQEIPEVPPTTDRKAVSYAVLPTLVKARDLPEFKGLGYIKYFRTSQGRKVAYVAAKDGKCVIAYRDRYKRGADKHVEAAVAAYARKLGFEVAAPELGKAA